MEIAAAFVGHGIEHILLGYDHLLFVLALMIIVRSTRALVWTITAFTLAHSITLALATLGVVHVPGPPVEAAIAFSILLLASEIVRLRRGESSVTARWPWIVAFGSDCFTASASPAHCPRSACRARHSACAVRLQCRRRIGSACLHRRDAGTLSIARRLGILTFVEHQVRAGRTLRHRRGGGVLVRRVLTEDDVQADVAGVGRAGTSAAHGGANAQPDRDPGAGGSALSRGAGARTRQGRHHRPPPARAQDGVPGRGRVEARGAEAGRASRMVRNAQGPLRAAAARVVPPRVLLARSPRRRMRRGTPRPRSRSSPVNRSTRRAPPPPATRSCFRRITAIAASTWWPRNSGRRSPAPSLAAKQGAWTGPIRIGLRMASRVRRLGHAGARSRLRRDRARREGGLGRGSPRRGAARGCTRTCARATRSCCQRFASSGMRRPRSARVQAQRIRNSSA